MKKFATLALALVAIGCAPAAPPKAPVTPAPHGAPTSHAEKPAEKAAETPADKPADAPADKPADAPAEKPADAPAEKPADAPAEPK